MSEKGSTPWIKKRLSLTFFNGGSSNNKHGSRSSESLPSVSIECCEDSPDGVSTCTATKLKSRSGTWDHLSGSLRRRSSSSRGSPSSSSSSPLSSSSFAPTPSSPLARSASYSPREEGDTVAPQPLASATTSVSSPSRVAEAVATVRGKRRHRATTCFDATELRARMDAIVEEQALGDSNGVTFNPLYALGRGEPPQPATTTVRIAEGTNTGEKRELRRSGSLSDVKQRWQKNVTHTHPATQAPSINEKRHVVERDVLSVSHDLPEGQRRRNLIINEIINTELDYIADLEILIDVFKTPLQQENIIGREELQTIFADVHLLVEVNRMLLEDMVDRVRATGGKELGESFILVGDYLKMYANYCANQPCAVEMASRCQRENPRFKEFLDKTSQLPVTKKLLLRDYLIKPVQRVCKYPLLLRELLKCTEESEPEHERLTVALAKLQKVVAVVEEKRQTEEDVEALAKIIERLHSTDKFGVTLMEPGRRFYQEGSLLQSVDQKEFTPVSYVLFNDLLVLTEPRSGKNVGASKNRHPHLEVIDVIPMTQCQMSRTDEKSSMLELAFQNRIYVIPFCSPQLKKKWIDQHISSRAATTNRFCRRRSVSLPEMPPRGLTSSPTSL